MHSAKKRQGKVLYKLARSGLQVDREALPCEIKVVRCLALTDDRLEFEVRCSSGTFIRVFAEDWAKRTNTLGHLVGLRRLQSKDKLVERAVDIDTLVTQLLKGECWSELDAFFSLHEMMGERPVVPLTQAEVLDLSYGRLGPLKKIEGIEGSQAALSFENDIVGLVEKKWGVWGYRKVFITPEHKGH
jgi:tRNA U55 pseudouridine synthase TruB